MNWLPKSRIKAKFSHQQLIFQCIWLVLGKIFFGSSAKFKIFLTFALGYCYLRAHQSTDEKKFTSLRSSQKLASPTYGRHRVVLAKYPTFRNVKLLYISDVSSYYSPLYWYWGSGASYSCIWVCFWLQVYNKKLL